MKLKKMKTFFKFLPNFSLVFLLVLTGCAVTETNLSPIKAPASAYITALSPSLAARFSPAFLVEDNHIPHNRIGTPIAWKDQEGAVHLSIDPDQPALYSQQISFQTRNGTYTNLIYRIHFQQVPFGLFPFYLTSGKNVGLIVIVTINKQEQPVLITSVHTCGCYLAFTPTSLLQEAAFPPGWNKRTQSIYGESLPGIMELASDPVDHGRISKILLAIRKDTHRVMGISLEDELDLSRKYQSVTTPLLPMQALKEIDLKGTTTSFFETRGPRKGYVKESLKPLERLLMSWWTMDWRIGEDKAYDPGDTTATPFNTSMKFWARNQSDMRDFPQFLRYWGWNL